MVIEFDTLEEFEAVNQRVTTELKQVEELDVYALPVEREGKWIMQVPEQYEYLFTDEELGK